ncbi:MAG TPA: Hsp20/alpha crystallin family protein [Pseudomonadales bacterium]
MFHTSWQPPADVYHAGTQWLIKLELAGVSPKEVDVRAQGNELVVRGHRRDLLQGGFIVQRMEILYTRFMRSFSLPAEIDADSITCEYSDGILRIWLKTL